MARTAVTSAYQPADTSATPLPIEAEPFTPLYNPLFRCHKVENEDVAMIVPGGRYPYDGDASPDAMWRDESEHLALWQLCEAYERIGDDLEDMQRIVQYRGRDDATGFPIVEMPAVEQPSLLDFIHNNEAAMYAGFPPAITPEYQRLVLRWAMMILSALKFSHRRSIFCVTIANLESYWLRKDLSLALVGFVGACFPSMSGNYYHGRAFTSSAITFHTREEPSVKTDLFDWATLVYRLMTRQTPEVEALSARGDLPALEDTSLGRFVHKCWRREYADAGTLLGEIQEYLRSLSVPTTDDDIEGFDLGQLSLQ